MIIHGSNNYTFSGRNRFVKRKRAPRPPFRTMQVPAREPSKYPSYESTAPIEGTAVQRQKSSKYTVAIAYNKGAYQVIPTDEIKNIGR